MVDRPWAGPRGWHRRAAERRAARRPAAAASRRPSRSCPTVFTAVAFGPLAAFAVAAISNLADFRRPYLRWAVYTPARALTGAAAGLAAVALSYDRALDFRSRSSLRRSARPSRHLTVDTVINMATQAVRGWWSPLEVPRGRWSRSSLIAVPLYVPAVSFLVYGYDRYSLAIVAMVFIPLLALQRVVHLYQEQRAAARASRRSTVSSSAQTSRSRPRWLRRSTRETDTRLATRRRSRGTRETSPSAWGSARTINSSSI